MERSLNRVEMFCRVTLGLRCSGSSRSCVGSVLGGSGRSSVSRTVGVQPLSLVLDDEA